MGKGIITEQPTSPWPGQAFTADQILERLNYWREHLIGMGDANNIVTRREVAGAIDRWLDELLDLRGR